jgi:hypothetical protein
VLAVVLASASCWCCRARAGLGRLPGDIYVQRGNWAFYFPLGTSIVLSVLLTLVFWLIGRR